MATALLSAAAAQELAAARSWAARSSATDSADASAAWACSISSALNHEQRQRRHRGKK
jgi:hypothetical protein